MYEMPLDMEGGRGQKSLNRTREIWPCQHPLFVLINEAILNVFLLYV